MRLTEQQITDIRNSVLQLFGESSCIYLFGSRTDDRKRGGDIDLLLEVDAVDDWLSRRLKLGALLERKLGEQQIDLVIHQRGKPINAIVKIARQTGLRL